MTSPGNQHCASCVGTLSFPILDTEISYHYTWRSIHTTSVNGPSSRPVFTAAQSTRIYTDSVTSVCV